VLKESKTALYGTTNIRNTPYQLEIFPLKKGLVMRCLLEREQIYDFKEMDEELINSEVIGEKIDVVKMLKEESLNLEEFKNERNEQIQELIRKTINGEIKLEDMKDVVIVGEVRENEKMEKLRKLKEKLAKKKGMLVKVK